MATAIYGAFNCGPLVLFAGARRRPEDYPCWRAGAALLTAGRVVWAACCHQSKDHAKKGASKAAKY